MKLDQKNAVIELLMVCLDYTYFFQSNRFISNWPSNAKLLSTFQGSTFQGSNKQQ